MTIAMMAWLKPSRKPAKRERFVRLPGSRSQALRLLLEKADNLEQSAAACKNRND
jgi:hypothetical protein